jgi:hypothetical protein
MKGYIYAMKNPALPGLLKIGFSMKDPEIRRRELSGTALPSDFEIRYEALIDSPFQIEQKIHAHLINYRVRENREFFEISEIEALLEIRKVLITLGVKLIYEKSKISEKSTSTTNNIFDESKSIYEIWSGQKPIFINDFGSIRLAHENTAVNLSNNRFENFDRLQIAGNWFYLYSESPSNVLIRNVPQHACP